MCIGQVLWLNRFVACTRVSKFVVENVFNNSHIEYNNECDNNNNNNNNKNDKYRIIAKTSRSCTKLSI